MGSFRVSDPKKAKIVVRFFQRCTLLLQDLPIQNLLMIVPHLMDLHLLVFVIIGNHLSAILVLVINNLM